MENEYNMIYLNDFQDFVCDGTYCNSRCCSGWDIEIDVAAVQRYRNMDKKTKGKIKKNIKYVPELKKYFIVLKEDYTCPFLRKDMLCEIQKENGEEYLSDICSVYPRKYIRFNEYIYAGLIVSCPVVVRNLINYREQLFLNENFNKITREQMIRSSNAEGDIIEHVLDIQCAGMNILQNDTYSIRDRLLLLCMFGSKIHEEIISHNEFDVIDEIINVFMSPITQQQIVSSGKMIKSENKQFIRDYFFLLDKLMLQMASFNRKQELEFGEKMIDFYGLNDTQDVNALVNLYEHSIEQYNKYILGKYPLLQENYLVHQWFGLVQPVMAQGNVMQNISVFLIYYRFMEMMLITLAGQRQDKITEKDVVDCICISAKILEHERFVFKIFADYIVERNYDVIELLSIWLPR